MGPLRIGTRGSRLALVQARWVTERLQAAFDSLEIELVEIRTTGDVLKRVPLGPELGSSFFTKEIEDALLEERIDLAVHSCKDLATRLPPGLDLAAVPEREDPRDVLVSSSTALEALPAAAVVGTSSPRRKGFLESLRPDISVRDQRGNVPTRVQAVVEGTVDAVVLAAAGLARLGMSDRISEYFEPDVMVPAAAQGALALQVRAGDTRSMEVAAALDHADSRRAVAAERACLRRLEAGCQAPVGAHARTVDGALVLEAAVVAPGGIARASVAGDSELADDVGAGAADEILAALGLPSLRDLEWCGPPPRAEGDLP